MKKFLLIFILIFSCNVCYGTTILEAFDIFYEATGPSSYMDTGSSTQNGTSYYSLANFRTLLSGRTDNCMVILSGGNTSLVDRNNACYLYTGNSFSNNYSTLNNYTMDVYKSTQSFNNNYNVTMKNGNYNVNTSWSGKFYYLFLENGQIVNTNIELDTFSFIPYGTQVNYQDYQDLPYASMRSYGSTLWNIGRFDDFGSYERILVTFSGVDGTYLRSMLFNGGTRWGYDGEVVLTYGYDLAIPSRYLSYNKAYNLILYLYTYTSDSEPSKTFSFNYLFLPLNATINNGEIVSTGSGDFTNQDVTNNIIDYFNQSSGETDLLFAGFFGSGDDSFYSVFSGDINLENNYYDYIYQVLLEIFDVLNRSGDVTLPITYRGYTRNLHSSDYFIPDSNPLKQFVRLFLVVGFIFLIYQQLDKIYKHMQGLEIGKILHDTDVDYDIFL